MLLLRILFTFFAICSVVFLVLSIFALDAILFIIAVLFAAASALVALETKPALHSRFHS